MCAARRRDADQRPQEFRIAGDQRRRQPPVADQRAPARRHPPAPLRAAAARWISPAFSCSHSSASMSSGTWLSGQAARRRRVLIDAIEDAGIAQITVGGGEAAVDLIGAERRRASTGTAASARARAPSRIHHLVGNAGQRPIAGQQAARGCRTVRSRSVVAIAGDAMARSNAEVERRRSSVVGYSSERFAGRQLDDARRVAVILEAGPAARLGLVGIDREGLVVAPARMRDVIDAAAERAPAPGVDDVEGQRRVRRRSSDAGRRQAPRP